MTRTAVKAAPAVDADIEHLGRFAALLDSRYRIPGTSIRFGWDALLGLIPGVGDAATLLPAAYLIYKGHRLGVSRGTLARMMLNTGIDATLGSVPLLGDVFDMFFKANNRNVALLRRELETRRMAGN